MKKIIEKGLYPIDSTNTCGDLAYGYSNKKEAIKAIEELTGEKVDVDLLQKVRVMKHIKGGDLYFFWGDECPECGAKNNGVLSYFHGE